MGDPGLDPAKALQIVQTILYSLAWILGAAVLVGLSAYIVFLCLEVFSPQPRSKARPAKVPHRAGCAPVAEENLDLAAGTPMPAQAERLSEEAGRVPALPDDAQMPVTVPANLESEPTWP